MLTSTVGKPQTQPSCCHLCHSACVKSDGFSFLVVTQWSIQTASFFSLWLQLFVAGRPSQGPSLPPFSTGVPCFLIGFSAYNKKKTKK